MTSPLTKGTLFVCGTPIGNLNDCSFRLIETLKAVQLIAAEDTRTVQKLLQRFEIQKKTLSLEKHNEAHRINAITKVLDDGYDVALVSEAGTPNIADPGSHLISKICEQGYSICPIPGPSAITTLLSVSGVLANQFCFGGFFPKKSADAIQLLTNMQKLGNPVVFYESGKRLLKTMDIILNFDAKAEVFVAKELTKLHETYWAGRIEDVKAELGEANLKGEWCFVVRLLGKLEVERDLDEEIKRLRDEGFSGKQMIFVLSKLLGYPKNKIYKLVHNE